MDWIGQCFQPMGDQTRVSNLKTMNFIRSKQRNFIPATQAMNAWGNFGLLLFPGQLGGPKNLSYLVWIHKLYCLIKYFFQIWAQISWFTSSVNVSSDQIN